VIHIGVDSLAGRIAGQICHVAAKPRWPASRKSFARNRHTDITAARSVPRTFRTPLVRGQITDKSRVRGLPKEGSRATHHAQPIAQEIIHHIEEWHVTVDA